MDIPFGAIAGSILLVLANGFFVIAEFALVRVRVTRLDELARQGRSAAVRARTLSRQLNAFLSACQLGVTLASLGLGWIGEPAFARAISVVAGRLGVSGDGWLRGFEAALAFGLLTAFHVVVGELAPKTVALANPERLALRLSGPMLLFLNVTRPAIHVLNRASETVVRLLRLDPAPTDETHSPEELRALLAEMRPDDPLDGTERDLIENAFDFPRHTVRQIMRPRGEIVYLSLARPLAETLETVRRSGYTRFPLCKSDLDEVVGMVHVKDLLFPATPLHEPADLLRVKHDPLFIPENVGIVPLLSQMRRRRVLAALAVDEYGVVSGMCTMEDVLEQLVGEIQDEHDHEQPEIRATSSGDFLVDGTMLIGDVNRRLLLDVGAPGCETISGLVTTRLGRLPRPGDSLTIDNYRVSVVSLVGFRIGQLVFSPMAPAAGARATGR